MKAKGRRIREAHLITLVRQEDEAAQGQERKVCAADNQVHVAKTGGRLRSEPPPPSGGTGAPR